MTKMASIDRAHGYMNLSLLEGTGGWCRRPSPCAPPFPSRANGVNCMASIYADARSILTDRCAFAGEGEGGVSNDDRIRIMNQVKAG